MNELHLVVYFITIRVKVKLFDTISLFDKRFEATKLAKTKFYLKDKVMNKLVVIVKGVYFHDQSKG